MYFHYRTAFGHMTIQEHAGSIVKVALAKVELPDELMPSALTNRCANELSEYFAGKRTLFDIPYHLALTPFKQELYAVIGEIPYGQTRTSTEVAELAGHPASYRLVGRALKENPLEVLIPTHRVATPSSKSAYTESEKIAAALRHLEAKNCQTT